MKKLMFYLLLAILTVFPMYTNCTVTVKADQTTEMEYELDTNELQNPSLNTSNGYNTMGLNPDNDGKEHKYDIIKIFNSPTMQNIARFVEKVAVLFIVVNIIIYYVFMQGNDKGQAIIKRVIIAWIVIFIFFGARTVVANTLQEIVDIFTGQT